MVVAVGVGRRRRFDLFVQASLGHDTDRTRKATVIQDRLPSRLAVARNPVEVAPNCVERVRKRVVVHVHEPHVLATSIFLKDIEWGNTNRAVGVDHCTSEGVRSTRFYESDQVAWRGRAEGNGASKPTPLGVGSTAKLAVVVVPIAAPALSRR